MTTTVSSITLCLHCSSTIIDCGFWTIAVKTFEADFAVAFLLGQTHESPTVAYGADGRQSYCMEQIPVFHF